jgi:hypothetical protein
MNLPNFFQRQAFCRFSPGELVVDGICNDGLHQDGASDDGERKVTRRGDELVRRRGDKDEEEDAERERVFRETFA